MLSADAEDALDVVRVDKLFVILLHLYSSTCTEKTKRWFLVKR